MDYTLLVWPKLLLQNRNRLQQIKNQFRKFMSIAYNPVGFHSINNNYFRDVIIDLI